MGFLCMGRCTSLGLLKSFLLCVSQLSGSVSCDMIFYIFSFSFGVGRSGSLRWFAGCQIAGTVLPGHTPGPEIYLWRAKDS